MTVMKTGRGLDRLVNFSDATVAIAITLLILPLADAAGDIRNHSLAELLTEHFATLLGFLISFVVIARFWLGHHQVFEGVEGYTTGILWANFLWLAGVIFMPFATNVITIAYGHSAEVMGLYVGTMILITVAMTLIQIQLIRRPGLLRPEARGNIDVLNPLSILILLVIVLVVSMLWPEIGVWWLMLLVLVRPVHLLLSRMAAPRKVPEGPHGE
ncbi:TMEM175 family protein [Psychromicrobium xiongbiense]|uniref:TMEM175 family protein n=1 Tax=Psychromicrobium xiongbiense TaxID=3051184 RepID=UPI002553F05A|nr:TMEM175 family protein [Psychromicrobium sp. YIM S02556]